MHLHVTLLCRRCADLQCKNPLKRKHDFEYTIEESMKIEFVYKYFYNTLFTWSSNLARD